MLLIDVDRFRDVNQYLGHRAADDVLRQLAERISVNATELEMAGRLGADEFVLICPTAGVAEAMARASEGMRAALVGPAPTGPALGGPGKEP